MSLLLYETDNTTLGTTWAFASTAAGSFSAAKTYHVWFNKGTPGGAARNVWAALESEITAGVWAEAGNTLTNRQEVQARISGSTNPSLDPAFPARSTTGYKPLGKGSWIFLGDISGNCAVYVDLRAAPAATGGSGTVVQNWRLRLISDTQSVGLSDLTGLCGIKTGWGDPSWSEWVKAPTVLASGSPDAVVNIGGSRTYTAYGAIQSEANDTVTGNQNDSAPAALTAGQAYWMVLSQPLAGGATVATKGTKATAAAAVLPALPADSLLMASAIVRYQAGGTSIIADTDITVAATDGQGDIRYSASSLSVTIGRVRALMPTVAVDQPSATTLTLTASVTSIIYLSTMGVVSATYAIDSLPLWSVTCDGSGVPGAPTDLRTLFQPGLVGPAGPAIGALLTTKGDIATFDTGAQRLGVGAEAKVLTADSAEPTGLKWRGGLVEITRIVCAGSQTTVDFTSIPASFIDLEVRYQAMSNVAGTSEALSLKINNDGTSGNYTVAQVLQAANTAVGASTTSPSASGMRIGSISGATAEANHPTVAIVRANNYSATVFYKHIKSDGSFVVAAGAGQELIDLESAVWKSTAAINRLTFSVPTSFVDGSVFVLYGLGAA